MSTKRRRKKMDEPLFYPDDLVVMLLKFFPKDAEFRADRELIHQSFFELRKSKPDLFEHLGFDEDRPFPLSKELDLALENLEMCDRLEKLNPRLRYYRIRSSDLENSYCRLEPRLKRSGLLSRVRESSKELQQKLGVLH